MISTARGLRETGSPRPQRARRLRPSSTSTTSAPAPAAATAAAPAGDPAADDEHVGVAAAVLGPPLALGLLVAQLAEPGGVAQDLLVQRPQPARPDERLVVEAGRRELGRRRVGDLHHVELERRLRVDVLDDEPLAGRLDAGPRAGAPSTEHEAVGALAGDAHQAAAAVVLEAARERPLAGGVQRRADRVALERGDALAVEREADRLGAVDPLAGLAVRAGSWRRSPGRLQQDFVGGRVALGVEPGAAAGAVKPPLALDPGDVGRK